MMNKTFALLLIAFLGFAAAALQPGTASAQDIYLDAYEGSSTKGPLYEKAPSEKRARKFFRGLSNSLLFLGEIPVQAFRGAHNNSPVTGSVVGAGHGTVRAFKRLGWGLWEVVTFWKPNEHERDEVGAGYFFRDYWTSEEEKLLADPDAVINWEPYIYPEVVFLDVID